MKTKKLYGRFAVRIAITLAVLLLIAFAGPWLFGLFSPFIFAAIFAWALNPLIEWITVKTRAPRKIVALLTVVLVLGIVLAFLFWLSYTVGNEIVNLSINWQDMLVNLEQLLKSGIAWLEEIFKGVPTYFDELLNNAFDALTVSITDFLKTLVDRIVEFAGNFAKGLPSVALYLVAFIMGVYFISSSFPEIRKNINKVLSNDPDHPVHVIKRITKSAFGGYLLATALLALIIGCINFIGFMILDIKYAVILAIFMAILDFLPYIGSGTALIPWGLITMLMGDFWKGAGILCIYAAVFIARSLLEPKLIGGYTGLSPLLTLISIYVGYRLWGIFGMILSPILFIIIINVYKSGVFDSAICDAKLIWRDISNKLRGEDKK